MKKTHKTTEKSRWVKTSTIGLVLVILLPLFLSYSNFYPPFIAKKYIYFLDSLVADIPFLPKTPKQIITKTLIQNRTLTNYAQTTTVLLESAESNKFKIVDLTIDNKIENSTSSQTKSQVDIHGKVNFFPNPEIDVKTIKDRDNFYLQVTKFPELTELNLGLLSKEWLKINLSEFQKGLGVKVRTDQQIIEDIQNQFGQIQSDLIDKSIFSKVTSSKIITEKNNQFYEIKINLEKTNLQKLPLIGDNAKFQKPVLRLLINTRTYFLTKLKLEGEINSNSGKVSTSKDSLNLKLESSLSNIGVNQNIETPKSYLKVKSPLDFALEINKVDKDINSFLNASKQAKDLGENLLTLERLLTVLILLPKSF